jgi:cell wall assembly regulator SMI1
MPATSLEDALQWLEAHAERVKRAPRGATADEIRDAEQRLGRTFPSNYEPPTRA